MGRKAKHDEPLVDSEAKKLGYKEKSSQASMPSSGKPDNADSEYGRDEYMDSPKTPQFTEKGGNPKKSY